MSKYQVYEWYSSDGELLYIGRSINAMLRASDHKSSSSWYYLATTCKISTFDNIETAKLVETTLISTLNPVFNITSNPRVNLNQVDLPYRNTSVKDFISKVMSQEIPLRVLNNKLDEYESNMASVAAKKELLDGIRAICEVVADNKHIALAESRAYRNIQKCKRGLYFNFNQDYKINGRSIWNILMDVQMFWFETNGYPHKAANKGLDIVFKLTGAASSGELMKMYYEDNPKLYANEEIEIPDFGRELKNIRSLLPC